MKERIKQKKTNLDGLDELSEGERSVDGNAVPQGELLLPVLLLGRCNRLGEPEEGQGQVDEPVLETLDRGLRDSIRIHHLRK